MNRRRLLAVIATAALAGCSASEPDLTPAATDTPTPTATASPTATISPTSTSTATDTPTDMPDPTDTPEPTPSEAERQANQAISDTRTEFQALLEAYCSEIDSDDDILEVTAKTEFYARGVQSQLAETQDVLNTARDRAVTDAQQETLTSFEASWQALRLMRLAQEPVIDAFGGLEVAREAARRADEGEMYDAISEMDSTYRDARAPKNDLDDDINGGELGAVEGLDEEVYESKITQFDGEVEAFGEVSDLMDQFHEGIDTLDRARDLESRGETDRAESTAANAADTLEQAARDLEDYADDLPDGAASFEDILNELSDVAYDQEDEARSIV